MGSDVKERYQEGQLKNDLRDLRDYFSNDLNLPKEVFQKDLEILTIKFLEQVDEKLNIILNNYDFLTEKGQEDKRKNFMTNLSNDLYMILEKNVFSSLKVPPYRLYSIIVKSSSQRKD